ncbi:transcriptional initiation protein Tat [Acidocella sp.]|uniref:thiosulfate dehydrogenase n=1 Tax=Acidocella sp. TaxID=50710 RepID=UPI00260C86E5|nr:transcriptional initiation protein Tat [Acidocella sp.]
MSENEIVVSRRKAVTLPLAGIGAAMVGAALLDTTPVASAATVTDDLLPANATKLKALTAALAAAPRNRNYTTVPQIVTEPSQWDAAALKLVLSYDGGPKQVWDNSALDSPWLNLMRNALNSQIWAWKHPNFLAVSATHGSAHFALYDNYIWSKYLTEFTGGKYKKNIWIEVPPAANANPADFQSASGPFSGEANSITVLQRRGVVFCGCHYAIWELSGHFIKKGINPDKKSHQQLAAELTDHLIPGVVLTPGIVGTIAELELAGFQYVK